MSKVTAVLRGPGDARRLAGMSSPRRRVGMGAVPELPWPWKRTRRPDPNSRRLAASPDRCGRCPSAEASTLLVAVPEPTDRDDPPDPRQLASSLARQLSRGDCGSAARRARQLSGGAAASAARWLANSAGATAARLRAAWSGSPGSAGLLRHEGRKSRSATA